MIIDRKFAKSMARIGCRAAYGAAIHKMLAAGWEFQVLSGDLGRSSGLDRVKQDFPSRFINCGIAEQNMIAFAAGFASEGGVVFVSSFAPFVTWRAADQVRMNLGYMEQPVVLVGLGSGFAMGFLGNSHFGLDDLAMVRSVPKLNIVAPADPGSIPKVLEALVENKRPTYLRLTGPAGVLPVYESDYTFSLGKANVVEDLGDDFVIVGHGSLLREGLEVVHDLARDGDLKGCLVDFHTIRPFDHEMLAALCSRFPYLFVLEEHFCSGGLFTEILEQINFLGLSQPQIVPLSVSHEYVQVGSYQYMLARAGLSKSELIERIKNRLTKEPQAID